MIEVMRYTLFDTFCDEFGRADINVSCVCKFVRETSASKVDDGCVDSGLKMEAV